jgi:hypothetical protein
VGLTSVDSADITINSAALLADVATGDPDWVNHIDGVDVLFQKVSSGSTTKYTLKATNPGTFKYQLSLHNETGTEIHVKGRQLPNIVKNGVTLKDRNGATTTVYLTVPSMPASAGTPSPLTLDEQQAPAFVLSGYKPVRAYPTDGSEYDHGHWNDELPVQVSWLAEYPAGHSDCASLPATTVWNTTTLTDGKIVRCIKVEGLEIKKHGEAHVRVSYEFRWKNKAGWGSNTSDAGQAFRAGFNFTSTTQVKLDDFNDDLLSYSHNHWSRLPQALKDKLLSDLQALWNTTYRGSHALGLAFAGEKVTALGGFLFDAGANGLPDITVRAFSSKPSSDACGSSVTPVASYTTGSDGFYFMWQIGSNNDTDTGTNTLPSGFKYYLALCDLTTDHHAMPFAQLYWPARSMSSTLNSKEFDEEDFFVSGPTSLAFQSQPITGKKNVTMGTVKVALLDAFGNVVTVDSTSRVTLSAVTAAGNSTALTSVNSTQPLTNRILSSGTASWTGLRLTAAGLYKLNATSTVPGVPDEKSLPINITN